MLSHLIEGQWCQPWCSVDSIIAIRDGLRSEAAAIFSAIVSAVGATLRTFNKVATKSDSRSFLFSMALRSNC